MSPAAQTSISGDQPKQVLNLTIKESKDGSVLCSIQWNIPEEDPMSVEDERDLSRTINTIIDKAITHHGVSEEMRLPLRGMFIAMVRQWLNPNG